MYYLTSIMFFYIICTSFQGRPPYIDTAFGHIWNRSGHTCDRDQFGITIRWNCSKCYCCYDEYHNWLLLWYSHVNYKKKSPERGVEGIYKAKNSDWKFSSPNFAVHAVIKSPRYHSKMKIHMLQFGGKCSFGTFKLI